MHYRPSWWAVLVYWAGIMVFLQTVAPRNQLLGMAGLTLLFVLGDIRIGSKV